MGTKKRTNKEVLESILDNHLKFSTVSGILTTTPEMISYIDKNIPEFEIITTKSIQIKPNPGNREPIIAEPEIGSFVNAVGLKNKGMEKSYEEIKALTENGLKAILNISLSANSINDFITLAKKFEGIADILELNLSCPHAKEGYGQAIGVDKDLVHLYVSAVKSNTSALVFPKLTPNVNNIGEIAKSAITAGADGISAINTVGPIEYIDPTSGRAVLYNPKGHLGGKSGEWITKRAIECITEIRKAIGYQIPIIGMGGVTTGEDVRNMLCAGANAIGLGSVLGRIKQQELPEFIKAVSNDALTFKYNSIKYISQEKSLNYTKSKIIKIDDLNENLRILRLSNSLDFQESQYAFLWHPDAGEKPFSIVDSNPLTFLIKRREYAPLSDKGLFTNLIFSLKKGDTIYLRGPYGNEVEKTNAKIALIVAGGSGIAVAPKLAKTLKSHGKECIIFHGIKDDSESLQKEDFMKGLCYVPITDNGINARVLDALNDYISLNKPRTPKDIGHLLDLVCYNIGPLGFMKKALDLEEKLGVSDARIYNSLELKSMCGIGICGECACGEKLTCQHGTFVSLRYLINNNINLLDYT